MCRPFLFTLRLLFIHPVTQQYSAPIVTKRKHELENWKGTGEERLLLRSLRENN
jgi:hypothetical protein